MGNKRFYCNGQKPKRKEKNELLPFAIILDMKKENRKIWMYF
jgi:hypothetical protein